LTWLHLITELPIPRVPPTAWDHLWHQGRPMCRQIRSVGPDIYRRVQSRQLYCITNCAHSRSFQKFDLKGHDLPSCLEDGSDGTLFAQQLNDRSGFSASVSHTPLLHMKHKKNSQFTPTPHFTKNMTENIEGGLHCLRWGIFTTWLYSRWFVVWGSVLDSAMSSRTMSRLTTAQNTGNGRTSDL